MEFEPQFRETTDTEKRAWESEPLTDGRWGDLSTG
jgi:hypothetical protein